MIVTCPNCATRYEMDLENLPSNGRKVRCKNCETVWLQEPVAEDADRGDDSTGDIPPVIETPKIDIETEAARLLAASKAASQKHRAKKVKINRALRNWLLLAACLAVIVVNTVIWRVQVVKILPAAADLYAAVYLPVNIRGVEFRNVSYQSRYENGVPVLTIRGEVTNITDSVIAPPRLRFSLSNKAQQELYHWTLKVTKAPLAPAGVKAFVTRLASPPDQAQHVHIRFARDKS